MQRRSLISDEGWLLSYADLITNLLIFFAMLLAAAQISKTRMQQISKGLSGNESPASLSSIQEEIEEKIKTEGLQDLIQTKLKDDGLELSLNSGVVFDSGHGNIRPELGETLDQMLQTLVPYSGKYDFAVAGHTDSNPILDGSIYPSNWELSTARANAVRERLEVIGIDRKRVRIEGYADTKPLGSEEIVHLKEDEILARHRRVVVRIY
jgi:chemotaxis protein MotB